MAEYTFGEEMQKFTILKDKTSALVKLMTVRGNQQDREDSKREELLQLN